MDWLTADSQLLDLLPVAVYVCEAPSGRIVRCNRRAVELTGGGPATADSSDPFDDSPYLYHPDGSFLATADALTTECLRTGRTYRSLEAVLERPDGSRVDVLVNIEPLRDPDGSILAAVVALQDVTERAEQHRALFEQAPQPMWVLAPGTLAFLAVNEAAVRRYGYSREEFLGLTLEEIWAPEDVPGLRERLSGGISGPELLGEWRHRRRDGRSMDVEISIQPLPYGGRMAHLVVANDVTARHHAEYELRQSEARFQAFMEHRPNAEWISDAEGRVIYVSPAYHRMFQVRDDVVGRSAWELYPPEFAETYIRNIREVVERGRVVESLELAPRRNGTIGKFIVYKFPLESEGQRWVGGVAIDVTEREAAERALRESEERLRLALEAGETGIWDWDLQNDRIVWSEQVYRFYGLTPGAFEGTRVSFTEQVHPEDRAAVQAAIRATLEGGAPFHIEFRTLLPNGEVRWITTTGKVLLDAKGFPVRMLGASHDVTERRRLEEELRSSEEQFRALVEQAPLSIQVFSPNGETLQVNHAWELLWDSTLERLQTSGYNLLQDPQLEEKGVMPYIRRAFAGEAVSIPPVAYNRAERHPDLAGDAEAIRWVRTNIYPIRDAGGTIRKVVLIQEDYTQRKRLEDALAGRVRELAEADRRKDEFLAMLAHELRNPLAPIVNALELQRLRPAEGEELTRQWKLIERNVQQLARLVDDLLEVSRITQNKIELRLQQVDLESVVSQAEGVVQGLVARKGQQLQISLPARPVYLKADPARLVQILVNLLNNAAKYTPEGGRLFLTATLEGESVVVRVRDTGTGIAPELLPRVFDLFVQGERSLARTEGGLGIGLTLVKRLVELHGGSVTAHSEGPGHGSEFVVRLPAVEGVFGAAPTPAPSTAEVPSHRVLVVEDNVDAAETLAELLELWGHAVRVAHDGVSALEIAREFRPRAVLLDIGLPGIDGYEVARRLRALPGVQDAALIALTGYGQEEDRRRSEAAGCDQHLTKPVDPERLRGLLAVLSP